jgi:hypothetical protein
MITGKTHKTDRHVSYYFRRHNKHKYWFYNL